MHPALLRTTSEGRLRMVPTMHGQGRYELFYVLLTNGQAIFSNLKHIPRTGPAPVRLLLKLPSSAVKEQMKLQNTLQHSTNSPAVLQGAVSVLPAQHRPARKIKCLMVVSPLLRCREDTLEQVMQRLSKFRDSVYLRPFLKQFSIYKRLHNCPGTPR